MRDLLKPVIIFLLAKESSAILKKYKPKIVAITGTVGKTSTRDAIYIALSEFEYVRKSPKNFNTEFGIPLTVIDMPNPGRDLSGWMKVLAEGLLLLILPSHYPKWLVLEVGTDTPGDIEAVTKWLKPDVTVITRLSEVPVHVENFPNPEGIFKEKGNLVRALKPDGILVLNGDDKKVMEYKKEFAGRIETFHAPQTFEIIYDNDRAVAIKPSMPIAAALIVAEALGFDKGVAKKSLDRFAGVPGRMNIIEGMNDSTIIDDTYNSSPIAVKEALNTLKQIKGKRKIAVLGDMLELGRYSADEHKKAGEEARKVADMLVTVGPRSRAMEGDDHFADSREAGAYLKDLIKAGDIILVKGSQGVRMERVVEALMLNPKDKKKLLIRQDYEWHNR